VEGLRAAFGQVVRRARKRAGLSQEQLGLDAGLARNFVSLIELGQTQPTLETVYQLAKALGCEGSKLLTLVEKELNTQPPSRPPARRTYKDRK